MGFHRKPFLSLFVYVPWTPLLTLYMITSSPVQSYSKRVANAKSDKYHQNVHKRGKVYEGREVNSNLPTSHTKFWDSLPCSSCPAIFIDLKEAGIS